MWLKNPPAFTILNEISGLIGLINKLLQLSRGARTEVSSYKKLVKSKSAAPAGTSKGRRPPGSNVRPGLRAIDPTVITTGLGPKANRPTKGPVRGYKSCSGLVAAIGRLTAKPKAGAVFQVQAYHESGWVKGDGQSYPLTALRRLYAGKAVVTKVKTMRSIFEQEGAMLAKVAKAAVGPVEPVVGGAQAPKSGASAAMGSSPSAPVVVAASAVPQVVEKRSIWASLSKKERMLTRQFWGVSNPSYLDYQLVERKRSVFRTRMLFECKTKGRKGRLARYLLKVAGYRQKEQLLASTVAKSSQVSEGRSYASVAAQSESGWVVIGKVGTARRGGPEVQLPHKTTEVVTSGCAGFNPDPQPLVNSPTHVRRRIMESDDSVRRVREMTRRYVLAHEGWPLTHPAFEDWLSPQYSVGRKALDTLLAELLDFVVQHGV